MTDVPSQDFQFPGLEWGISRDDAVENLTPRNYELKYHEGKALSFRGIFRSCETDLILYFAPSGGLYHVGVRIPRQTVAAAKTLFDQMHRGLEMKYGKPERITRTIEERFEEGDGQEKAGFKSGNRKLYSSWRSECDTGAANLSLGIDENLTVILAYTAHGEAHEIDAADL